MKTGELALVYSDLKTARTLFSPYRNKGKELDAFIGNTIIYHCVQAIEKTLKGVLSDLGNRDRQYTHDISSLQNSILQINPSFFDGHPFLVENDYILTTVNNVRYGGHYIDPSLIVTVLREASQLFEEQFKEWSKHHGGASAEEFQFAAKEYEKKLSPLLMIQNGRTIGDPNPSPLQIEEDEEEEER